MLRHQLIGGELERLGIPRRDLQIVFAARGVERIILVRADQIVAANRAALFDHTRDQLVENALDQDLVAGDRHARLAVCNISVCQQSAQRTEVLDQRDRCAALCSADGRTDAGRAAAYDQHIDLVDNGAGLCRNVNCFHLVLLIIFNR